MFVFRLRPPLLTLDVLCVVLCICLCQSVCVCVFMCVGPHMPMHASSVLIFMRVCVLSPPSPTLVSPRCETCVNVFVLVLFQARPL